jgi:hypothetical protein
MKPIALASWRGRLVGEQPGAAGHHDFGYRVDRY